MNVSRRITANFFWVTGSRGLGKACAFILILLLARYLGAEGLGKFAFVTAYLALFGILTDLGLDMILIREASQDLKGSEPLVGNGIVLKAVLAVTVYAVTLLVASLLGYDSEKLLYIAIAGAGFFLAPLTCYSSAFFSTLNLHLPSFFEGASRVLILVIVVFLVIAGAGLALIFLTIVLGGVLEALCKVIYSRRYFRPRLRVHFHLWKWLLKEVWPLTLVLIPILLIQRIDQVMLEGLRGDVELGYYSAATRLCEAFLILPVAVLSSLFPLLSRYYAQDRASFERTWRLAFKYLAVLGATLFFFLFFVADKAVTLLFGEPFASAAAPLRVLGASLPLLFTGLLHGALFVVIGRQKGLIPIAWLATAVNVCLNILWIPSYGAVGAGFATVTSYGVGVAGMSCYPSLGAYGTVQMKSLLRAGLPGVVSLMICCIVFPDVALLKQAVFWVLYGCALVLIGTVTRGDLRLVREMLFGGSRSEALEEDDSRGTENPSA
jgi:PST family polysaccharide transporter